jgi:hypothetical protein
MCLDIASGLFPSEFPTSLYAFPFLPMGATYPAHLILLDFFALTIFDERVQISELSFMWFYSPSRYLLFLRSKFYHLKPINYVDRANENNKYLYWEP